MDNSNSHTQKGRQKIQNKFGNLLTNFLVKPIISGIVGFLLFFFILVATKWLSYVLGTQEGFAIEIDDLFLSSIGFILIGLIKLLENFKEKD